MPGWVLDMPLSCSSLAQFLTKQIDKISGDIKQYIPFYVVSDVFYRQDFIKLNISDHCSCNFTELCLNKIPILKSLLCMSIWIFHERGCAFHFLSIQSVFSLYLQNGLEVFI